MYGVFDEKGGLVAYHDRRSVVETYVNNIYRYKKIRLYVRKIRKRQMDILMHKEDLYLMVYGNTYIQSGYLTYLELTDPQVYKDTEFALDVLYRELELRDFTRKEKKSIHKTITVLEDILEEDRSYTPTLQELETMRSDIEPYIYKYRDGGY